MFNSKLNYKILVCLKTSKFWFVDMNFREESSCLIEYYPCGTKFWSQNGLYHREDGPAIECSNGAKYWYKNGVLHRENGPAVEFSNGTNYWHLNGKILSEKEFKKLKNVKF